jgi:hypothetical protein
VSDASRIEHAKRVWAAFEQSIELPFEYDNKPPKPKVSSVNPMSEWAMTLVQHGVAYIALTNRLLDARLMEQKLTLLHESLHIASFTGPLLEMYGAVKRHRTRYSNAHPISHWLGLYMYEVDAELALAERYKEYAAARASYYVKVQQLVRQQERAQGWCVRLSARDPARPYYVLGDRLCAELAGLLAGDKHVETQLCSDLEQPPPACAHEIETVRQMLSPISNDYADLPRWGAARYEEVVRRVTEGIGRGV